MRPFQSELLELASLTQLFLLQEFSRKDWLESDAETYAYFKQLARYTKQPPQPIQKPPAAAPLPSEIKALEKKLPVKTPANRPLLKTMEIKPPQDISIITEAVQPQPIKPFSLELNTTKASIDEIDFGDFRKIIAAQFPKQTILDHIPDDTEARNIHTAWKAQPRALLLFYHEDADQRHFLQQVCNAIQLHLAPAKMVDASLIQQGGDWNKSFENKELRLILASTSCFQSLAGLHKSYRKNENDEFLNNIPLLLLSDISAYLNDQKLKASLWKRIQTIMKSR